MLGCAASAATGAAVRARERAGEDIMSGEMEHLTDAGFAASIQGEIPILVDFWAAWCAPCRMLAPILEELADEYEGRLRIAKLNVDEESAAAQQYGIQSIPTLLLFKNGEVADKVVGVVPKEALSRLLEKHL
jgi:thioredoxin 1